MGRRVVEAAARAGASSTLRSTLSRSPFDVFMLCTRRKPERPRRHSTESSSATTLAARGLAYMSASSPKHGYLCSFATATYLCTDLPSTTTSNEPCSHTKK